MRFLAAFLAAAALAPAALADAPDVVTHENVDRTRTINVCGFPVVLHSEGVFTIWQYLDDSGAVVRERYHVERAFTVTWSNPANGKSISSVLGGPVFVDYYPDGSFTQIVAGRERLFIARGEGPVATAGRPDRLRRRRRRLGDGPVRRRPVGSGHHPGALRVPGLAVSARRQRLHDVLVSVEALAGSSPPQPAAGYRRIARRDTPPP